MNIFIGIFCVIGIIFVFSFLIEYFEKKEKEREKLEIEAIKWRSKRSETIIKDVAKEIFEILKQDKIINNTEKNN